jgi:hypothetical protein
MEKQKPSKKISRPIETTDENIMFNYLEPRCRTCKKPLLLYETRINNLREEGLSDLEIFEHLGIDRNCCRNAISNPVPMSLSEYIGPEVQLHKILEEPIKKVVPSIVLESEVKVPTADARKQRVNELMSLASNITKAQKSEGKAEAEVKSGKNKPVRVNIQYAV